MEDTLRDVRVSLSVDKVLILVLMEDTLRDGSMLRHNKLQDSLNPCFNGRYSQRKKDVIESLIKAVLILVLMEDTLRAKPTASTAERQMS